MLARISGPATTTLTALTLAFALAGCGSRDALLPDRPGSGSGGAGGTTTSDAGSGGGAPDGGYAAYGYVGLSHMIEEGGSWGYEQLALSAACYGEPYDPQDNQPGFIETLQTPDGIACDIYYVSGMMEDPPDPEPPQIDGGRMSAWAGWDSNDALAVTFAGGQYSVDVRSLGDPNNPMPGWLVPEAIAVTFEGDGSPAASAFSREAILPAFPAIIEPAYEQVWPGPDGNFYLAWQASAADEILVQLQFNLDWDNSIFICHPPAGVTQMLLPVEWIAEWTWGYGQLLIIAHNEVSVTAGAAQISLHPARLRARSVYFDYGW